MIGPGKYDKECEELLIAQDAVLTCVIVVGGKKGPGGFSLSANAARPEMVNAVLALPQVLRQVADQIEGGAGKLTK